MQGSPFRRLCDRAWITLVLFRRRALEQRGGGTEIGARRSKKPSEGSAGAADRPYANEWGEGEVLK